jgi:predicted nucleic acid-binding protein
MICLDTNYLIMALVPGSLEAKRIAEWGRDGESFCASSVVWYEFVCGPVTDDQITAIRALLQEVVPFDEAQARESARLFNAAGRKRPLRVDSMIAAAAVTRQAALATGNTEDFRTFVDSGLRLVE